MVGVSPRRPPPPGPTSELWKKETCLKRRTAARTYSELDEGGRPESVARFTVSLSPKVTMFFGTKLILGNAHWASAQASADFAAADIAVLDIALEPVARRVGVTIRSDWLPTTVQNAFLLLIEEGVHLQTLGLSFPP